MRQRVMIIIIAIFFGLAAAAMVTNYARQARNVALENTKTTKVLMATDSVPIGLTLEELKDKKLVEVRRVPKDFVASDAIKPKQKLKNKTLTTSLSVGEQVTAGKFKVAKDAGLAFTIPEGMVAVAIPIDNMKAAGNLIQIGDFVNVVGTAETPVEAAAATSNKMTKTFLQNVEVLAVGSNLENPRESKTPGISDLASSEKTDQTSRTATLALSQSDAEKLIYMQEEGRIWLTLLPSKKAQTIATRGQTVQSVFE